MLDESICEHALLPRAGDGDYVVGADIDIQIMTRLAAAFSIASARLRSLRSDPDKRTRKERRE
jgi:hypothetical protein